MEVTSHFKQDVPFYQNLAWLDYPSFRALDTVDFREKYDTDHDGKLSLVSTAVR